MPSPTPPPPRLQLFAPLPSSSSSVTSTPRICTIAGSDSGGGAGIQADLKTFLALGAYGLSVITALTAQNTRGVSAIHVPPADFLREQIRSVRRDVRIDAFKIGMLGNAEVIDVVATELADPGDAGEQRQARPRRVPVVLDPVMVSTSGSLLLSHDAIHVLIDKMLPHCTLLTPNLPETRQLLVHARAREQTTSATATEGYAPELETIQDLLQAAKELASLGPEAVLVKGGHRAMKRREMELALAGLGLALDSTTAPPRTTVQVERDGDALATGAEVTNTELKGGSFSGETLHCVRSDSWPNSHFVQYLAAGTEASAELRQPKLGPSDDDMLVVDVLYERERGEYTLFVKAMVDRTCTHGTGCTLSSALATHLGVTAADPQAPSIREAVWKSINYVQAAIARGYEDLGGGPGPLDHSVTIGPVGVLRSTAGGLTGSHEDTEVSTDNARSVHAAKLEDAKTLGVDPTPFTSRLIARSLPLWRSYVWHPFVQCLAHPYAFAEAATADPSSATQPSETAIALCNEGPLLPIASFVHFLKQDYSFLLHYSRVWSTAASMAKTFTEAAFFNKMASAMADEAASHVHLCHTYFGVGAGAGAASRESSLQSARRELEATVEGPACLAYTRYVLDVARSGDGLLGLLVATLPCLVGYAEMGLRVQAERERRLPSVGEGAPPRDARLAKARQGLSLWVDMYAEREYHDVARAGVAQIEEMVVRDPPSPEGMRRLQGIWDTAVRLGIGFWDEATKAGRG